MKPYEKLKQIRTNKNITTYELSELTGIPQSTISKMENGKRKIETESLQKLAVALGVSVNEFFDEEDHSSEENIKLNKKDEKDIKKALNETLDQLENSQDGLMFDGEPIDDETRELLRISLENSMRLAKEIAKKKYTPKKYKK
ncbi:MAG: helix-turn-helix transcriptional regulator [Clostridium botulinum]|uniref:helix-turn-helix domain-containing protein n=1 Tax=Clostridium sporogenes TaxID=1509 RepID=UPI001C60DA79|nr:helix-turn-helix transcriptional regulator [Clostridium sporogenes]MBW5456571.1 helix-turn-helix domain-containing protein [Clostridium sporogenes]MDU2834257.1 helix-turn-helix transcriptional regulator [Clostridium botulinum]